MTEQSRLSYATRGFRGRLIDRFYVNESIELDEGILNITIVDTLRVDTIETIAVDVKIDSVGVSVKSIQIEGSV